MQILLIAATAEEIKPVTEANPGIDILVTGVGVPSTIYHLQKRVHQLEYDLIIQAGIAGTFNSKLDPGTTVWIKQDCFGDLGTEEKGIFVPVFETGLSDKNEFPFSDGWLVNNNSITNTMQIGSAIGITVNKVTDSPIQKKQLIEHFNPSIESMEGAALHYVCLQENIPFLQLRSVSNNVGERDKSKWKMKEAIGNLNDELQKLFTQLNNQ